MPTLTTTSRPRAVLLLALLALAALAAAVLPPPPPVNAAPPDDLTLSLSLIEDSDDIVPAGGSLQLRATLSSTTAAPRARGHHRHPARLRQPGVGAQRA